MRIEILHLSDLHLSSQYLTDLSVVREALISRLNAEVQARGAPDVVVFSGDLVQAGSALEFELAKKEFIDPVLRATTVTQDRFIIVPGNHDIDREAVRSEPELESGLKLKLNNRDALRLGVTHRRDRSRDKLVT
jgi:3',5'-cyclic AMP phosphodiesterase CpdA